MNVRVGTVEWAALGVHRAWAGDADQERIVRIIFPQLGDALDTLEETIAVAERHEG